MNDPQWLIDLEQDDSDLASIIRRERGGAEEKGLDLSRGCCGSQHYIEQPDGSWLCAPENPCTNPPKWYYVPSDSGYGMLACEEHVPKDHYDGFADAEWDLIEGSVWGDPCDFP